MNTEPTKNAMCHIGLGIINDTVRQMDDLNRRWRTEKIDKYRWGMERLTLNLGSKVLLAAHVEDCPACLVATAQLGETITKEQEGKA